MELGLLDSCTPNLLFVNICKLLLEMFCFYFILYNSDNVIITSNYSVKVVIESLFTIHDKKGNWCFGDS